MLAESALFAMARRAMHAHKYGHLCVSPRVPPQQNYDSTRIFVRAIGTTGRRTCLRFCLADLADPR